MKERGQQVFCLVALLFACANPAAPAPTGAPVVDCPSCPEARPCPEPACPALECSRCAEPAPEPVAHDWHCIDVERADGISGYCSTLASVCELLRKSVIEERLGKPSACTTQRVAYCILITDANSMSRQTLCARRAESCKKRRETFLRETTRNVSHATECQPTLNTDTFETGQLPAMPEPW